MVKGELQELLEPLSMPRRRDRTATTSEKAPRKSIWESLVRQCAEAFLGSSRRK